LVQLGDVGCPRVSAVSQRGSLHSHPEVFPRLHQVAVAAARPTQETRGKIKFPIIFVIQSTKRTKLLNKENTRNMSKQKS
jgi:hypothetical protein